MGKNLKGLLAGVFALILLGGFSWHGYFVQHQHTAITGALIAGIVLTGIDWAVRKPGRGPNEPIAYLPTS